MRLKAIVAFGVIARSTQHLQVLYSRITTSCIWHDVVNFKTLDLLFMSRAFAYQATFNAGIRITMVYKHSHSFGDAFP
jgi:hypothetical protein